MQEPKQELKNRLLIDGSLSEEIRIALVNEENELLEYNTQQKTKVLVGNIYLGIIEKVELSIEAAFVKFSEQTSGFLSFADIHPDYYLNPSKRRARIHQAIKKGMPLIVQVTREPTDSKSANLTTYVALTSKNCILFPKSADNSGVSKKISGENRKRLKEFLATVDPKISLIIRTASHSANIKEIQNDYNKLIKLWKNIEENALKKEIPCMLFEEDALLKTLLTYSKYSIESIHIENKTIYSKILDYVSKNLVKFPKIIELSKNNLFKEIEQQINILYNKQLELPYGGSIVIEHTEALTTIDVNSKSLRGKNMAQTAFKTNMEAVIIAAKQIMLRNIGGLIVIDFIDMDDEEDIKLLNKSIKAAFKNDKASVGIIGYSALGLVQISRQRLNVSILLKNFNKCKNCLGYGYELKTTTQAIKLLRKIKTMYTKKNKLQIYTSQPVLQEILNNFAAVIANYRNLCWEIVEKTDQLHNEIEIIKSES